MAVELPKTPPEAELFQSLPGAGRSFLLELPWELHPAQPQAACTFIDTLMRNQSEWTSIRMGPSFPLTNRCPWAENEKWSEGRPDDWIEEDPARSLHHSNLSPTSSPSSPRWRVWTRVIARLASRPRFRSDGADKIHPFEPRIPATQRVTLLQP